MHECTSSSAHCIPLASVHAWNGSREGNLKWDECNISLAPMHVCVCVCVCVQQGTWGSEMMYILHSHAAIDQHPEFHVCVCIHAFVASCWPHSLLGPLTCGHCACHCACSAWGVLDDLPASASFDFNILHMKSLPAACSSQRPPVLFCGAFSGAFGSHAPDRAAAMH
jgi:hypothetical protein